MLFASVSFSPLCSHTIFESFCEVAVLLSHVASAVKVEDDDDAENDESADDRRQETLLFLVPETLGACLNGAGERNSCPTCLENG